MEQAIQFTELDGRRIAYATVGEGLPLVFGGRWVTRLEEEWEDTHARAFFQELARTHRVVRYDRIGAGLSDRELDGPPTLDSEARALTAVLDASTDGPRDGVRVLLREPCLGERRQRFARARSEARLLRWVRHAQRHPGRDAPLARRLRTDELAARSADAGRAALCHMESGDDIAALSRYQRHSANAEVAAAFLELDLISDSRAFLPKLTMPALVLHRRGDRTVPLGRGRELAAPPPERPLRDARGRFAPSPPGRPARAPAGAGRFPRRCGSRRPSNGDSPLSRRETDVLRLVASGLSNREIASSLVLSEHTVHRHVANILRKLEPSSRAAAAAQATRAGFI